jgi:hypothetical protein
VHLISGIGGRALGFPGALFRAEAAKNKLNILETTFIMKEKALLKG